MKFHYNIKSIEHLTVLAEEVCDVLGYGSNGTADLLLLETSAAESQCGLYKDPTPNGAGYGPTQFDFIGFVDTRGRTRVKDTILIIEHFGVDIMEVQIEDLANDPKLAFIFTRLKYKLRPEPIPKHLKGRADYWKKWWNTEAGKGTPEHYISSVLRHLPQEDR
jgi:hypothetical protein